MELYLTNWHILFGSQLEIFDLWKNIYLKFLKVKLRDKRIYSFCIGRKVVIRGFHKRCEHVFGNFWPPPSSHPSLPKRKKLTNLLKRRTLMKSPSSKKYSFFFKPPPLACAHLLWIPLNYYSKQIDIAAREFTSYFILELIAFSKNWTAYFWIHLSNFILW